MLGCTNTVVLLLQRSTTPHYPSSQTEIAKFATVNNKKTTTTTKAAVVVHHRPSASKLNLTKAATNTSHDKTEKERVVGGHRFLLLPMDTTRYLRRLLSNMQQQVVDIIMTTCHTHKRQLRT